MLEFDKILLVWRKGSGGRRSAVGELVKTPDGNHVFSYLPEALELQQEEGFIPYPEFQDLQKIYNGNVADIFGQRLMKGDRPDIASFYNFWEVDEAQVKDNFYLLGKTQGLVPTDNFEFLAEYKFQPELHFLTEIASLSSLQLPKNFLRIGDKLEYELERDNKQDQFAVKLFRSGEPVGYIKKYHSKVFYETGLQKLNLTVKAIEQNGMIKRVFLKVSV